MAPNSLMNLMFIAPLIADGVLVNSNYTKTEENDGPKDILIDDAMDDSENGTEIVDEYDIRINEVYHSPESGTEIIDENPKNENGTEIIDEGEFLFPKQNTTLSTANTKLEALQKLRLSLVNNKNYTEQEVIIFLKSLDIADSDTILKLLEDSNSSSKKKGDKKDSGAIRIKDNAPTNLVVYRWRNYKLVIGKISMRTFEGKTNAGILSIYPL